MVNKNFEILDEGKNKFLPVSHINMTKIDLYQLCLQKCSKVISIRGNLCPETLEYEWNRQANPSYKEPSLKIRYGLKKTQDLMNDIMLHNSDKSNKKWKVDVNKRFSKFCGGDDVIYDFLEIIPFVPSVMINISPDWKQSELKTEFGKSTVLKKIIDDYLAEGWYSKWSYVIENGSNGNHIHAHIVAQMDGRKTLKSCETHLRKGAHTPQLIKYAGKVKGIKGCIKGVSIQKTFLRNETLVSDKLKYLIEENKPEGHKNKSVIPNGFVSGGL
ncbi:MAG: hypothetical protein [Circular genetic element sp.]|nr:MAG: hypothetical protein [Circular genetic element sp.]